jgi:hypothetical protein
MGYSLDNIRGVQVQRGERETGRTQGDIKTEGLNGEKVYELTGQVLSDLINQKFFMEAGSRLVKATLVVDEAFDLATSSVVEIGEDGAEATNGVSLTEANLESTGIVDVTSALAGEWAATSVVPHYQDVGIAFSAGSVADASVGKARVIFEYLRT